MNRDDHVMSMSEVQKLTGLSARTLQYYDDMGYLRVGRDQHGYRIYTEEDIRRLFRILLFKEMGFPLKDINRILADPDGGIQTARSYLQTHRKHLDTMADILDMINTLGSEQVGFELFHPREIRKECCLIKNKLRKLLHKENVERE